MQLHGICWEKLLSNYEITDTNLGKAYLIDIHSY